MSFRVIILHGIGKTQIKKKARARRWWVRPIFLRRKQQGVYHNLIQEMRLNDRNKYFNFLRMTPHQFDELLTVVGPKIERLYVKREPISAAQRLAITLRYLDSGDSMISISYAFRVGTTTVSDVIHETCEAIWSVLKGKVFLEDIKENWMQVSEEFEQIWQLPHCIGAVDGKHIVIQAPMKSGSEFYNYKGSHSIVLMVLADANYKFIAVDIGAHGRQSDGGIFRNSDIGKRLLNHELHLPRPSTLESGGIDIPYYVVGDSAFPLNENLMRPYAGNFLPQHKRIFNYRLSRGRRVSENAFGILASRWRILRTPIIASLQTVENIVGAVVVLHNYLMSKKGWDVYCPNTLIDQDDSFGNIIDGEWRQEEKILNLFHLNRTGTNMYKKHVENIRENIALYFCTEGAVSFQWDK